MTARAPMAPANTVNRGYLIAIIAAIKNVLSPNSETTMTEIEATNAWRNPKFSNDVAGVPGKLFCKNF